METIKPVNVEDRQIVSQKIRRKAQWSKKRVAVIIILLFLLLSSSISAVVGYLAYRTYQTDLALAQTGMQHLRSAVTLLESLQAQPFAPRTVEQAQQEFAGALSNAQAIEASLANYSSTAGLLPIYGPRLEAAIHLTMLAVDISQAGIGGCKILETVLSQLGSPLSVSAPTPGLTNADFNTISNEYQIVKTSLNGAMNEAILVQPGDVAFDAHLAKLLQEFQASIPTLRAALTEADQLLPALPTLLGIGTPTHYLLEILDSTELRPGGGFIGNYGIATLSGGRLTSAHITDVDLLDRPFEFAGHTIPYPPAYAWFSRYLGPGSWSLRDSNLDADFPTAARNGELNYMREGGKVPVQGVIALTPAFIEQALAITGPISVPEYGETVTAQNLVARIHYHQLGPAGEGPDYTASPDGHSSLRKRFSELLAEHLLARVRQLPASDFSNLLYLMVNSLRTKDLQIYFNSAGAESVLQDLHLNAAIQAPVGDGLFVVDANVAADKANEFIVNTLDDQVTIDAEGNAIHRTTIRYAWTIAGHDYGHPRYQDYVRVYVPTNSVLLAQDGWQAFGTSQAFGREVWAGSFTLVYGQTRTITLVWTSHSVAERDAAGWRYQYLLQRQAGIQRTLKLQVTLPLCADVTNTSGGLISNGQQEETLTQALTQDLNVGVDYRCK